MIELYMWRVGYYSGDGLEVRYASAPVGVLFKWLVSQLLLAAQMDEVDAVLDTWKLHGHFPACVSCVFSIDLIYLYLLRNISFQVGKRT